MPIVSQQRDLQVNSYYPHLISRSSFVYKHQNEMVSYQLSSFVLFRGLRQAKALGAFVVVKN